MKFQAVALCLMKLYNIDGGENMNDRGLKTRVPISSTIDKKLNKKLRQLSEDTRVPMSKLLDEAIEDLIKKHKS